jgi:hypothetical protein
MSQHLYAGAALTDFAMFCSLLFLIWMGGGEWTVGTSRETGYGKSNEADSSVVTSFFIDDGFDDRGSLSHWGS